MGSRKREILLGTVGCVGSIITDEERLTSIMVYSGGSGDEKRALVEAEGEVSDRVVGCRD